MDKWRGLGLCSAYALAKGKSVLGTLRTLIWPFSSPLKGLTKVRLFTRCRARMGGGWSPVLAWNVIFGRWGFLSRDWIWFGAGLLGKEGEGKRERFPPSCLPTIFPLLIKKIGLIVLTVITGHVNLCANLLRSFTSACPLLISRSKVRSLHGPPMKIRS